jgi:hypothetical protein
MTNSILLATATLVALAMPAAAGTTQLFDENGNHIGAMATYSLDGKPVEFWGEDDGSVEIRLVPGWKLDPNCSKEKWGEDCNGGQGFVMFKGNWSENSLNGDARLDRKGCENWFGAYIHRTRDGRLELYPHKGFRWIGGRPASSSKCKTVFRPAP